jgi:hypothetical protein
MNLNSIHEVEANSPKPLKKFYWYYIDGNNEPYLQPLMYKNTLHGTTDLAPKFSIRLLIGFLSQVRSFHDTGSKYRWHWIEFAISTRWAYLSEVLRSKAHGISLEKRVDSHYTYSCCTMPGSMNEWCVWEDVLRYKECTSNQGGCCV